MEYIVDDKKLDAFTFIAFVKQVWQGNYDIEKTQCALSQTINITAYENEALIGCLRILTDGYYFGTITELLVLPEYQKQGVGSKLLQLAKDNTPTMLYETKIRCYPFGVTPYFFPLLLIFIFIHFN